MEVIRNFRDFNSLIGIANLSLSFMLSCQDITKVHRWKWSTQTLFSTCHFYLFAFPVTHSLLHFFFFLSILSFFTLSHLSFQLSLTFTHITILEHSFFLSHTQSFQKHTLTHTYSSHPQTIHTQIHALNFFFYTYSNNPFPLIYRHLKWLETGVYLRITFL